MMAKETESSHMFCRVLMMFRTCVIAGLGLRCSSLARLHLASGRGRNDIHPIETATMTVTGEVVTPKFVSLSPTFRMT